MVKFMLMKLTLKQMNGLLGTIDSALVRAIGFLYLRYTCPPADLYKWYEPFLEDEEEFSPLSDKSVTMTVGAFVTKLLTDMQYYGTTLPRIPVPIERKMKVMLLLLNEKKTRRKNNLRAQTAGRFAPGAKVRAIYSDAENEPAWYEAVVESVDDKEENKYWVKFPEYGNTEHLDLGEMELLDGDGPGGGKGGDAEPGESTRRGERDDDYRRSQSNDRDRGGRDRRDDRDQGSRRAGRESRSRSRDRGDDRRPVSSSAGGSRHASSDNLMEKVLQNEREASAAVGRNYGHRPASYKGSLSMQVDRYTTRQKSPPRESTYRGGGGGGDRDRRDDRREGGGGSRRRSPSPVSSSGGGGRSLEASMEAINRMKMLKARYGDASAK